MKNKLLIILLLLTGQCLPGRSQSECEITHFDEFDGMAQWYVTQIVQDNSGMMWFATWNGLNRYDGYQFECFKSEPGDSVDLPSDRFTDIMLDKDGNLLCSVDGRAFAFNVSTCKFSTMPKDREVMVCKEFELRHQREINGNLSPYTYKDRYGTAWTFYQDGRITYTDPVSRQETTYNNAKLKGNKNYFCTSDTEGNAWLRGDYGAYRLTFSRKPYELFRQEVPMMVRCFFVDAKQRYWVTTRNDATVRLFRSDNTPLGYLGPDGRLHAGYTRFTSPIYHMMQDSKGYYWMCSKPGGLYRMHETTDGQFQVDRFITDDGNAQGSLRHNDVYYAVEDGMGRIWVATFGGGIHCLEDPHAAHPHFLHAGNGLQLSPNKCERVRQICITSKGILLAATTTGLLIADLNEKDPGKIRWHNHLRDINRSSSLSNNATMFVAEDHRQRLFVCTESGGVNEILSEDLLAEELDFRQYDKQTGMPSDVALSAIAVDDYLLIVSNNQVIKLYPDQLNDGKVSYESFFWQDRMRFSDAIPTLLPDGRRIFGLQEGALVISPKDLVKSQFSPPIVLTGLSIEGGPTNHNVVQLDTLSLSPSERNFTLYFAALEYAAGSEISYAFRIGDEKANWNYIGHDHLATFLNLQPGTYQLTIRSTNGDGVWVDNQRVLTIIVSPTFWETPWAQLLYMLLAALVIWAILRTRHYIRNINQQRQQLHEAYLALLNTKSQEPLPTVQPTSPTANQPVLKPEDDAFMRKAMKFIDEHLGDSDINIGDLADATATSRSGLNRKMKQLMGVTPLDFIREARIHKACQLLKDGGMVNDVAYECGFSDPKYFTKSFKSQMGMTPSEYKVENQAS